LKATRLPTAVTEEYLTDVLGKLQERFAVAGADGKKELLPLDDDFAKKVSHVGTLAELKEEIRIAAQKEKAAETEADLRDKLIAAVAAETQVEIAPAMVAREVEVMLDELRTSLAQSGLTLEDYLRGAQKEETAMRADLSKSAEMRVKGKVVLKAVAEAEQLVVTPEELQAELKAMAAAMGEEVAAVEKRLEAAGRQYINDYLLRKKALDLLVAKASIKPA
jgi:trigger factor